MDKKIIKVIIDAQSIQTGGKFRGISRYTITLIDNILRISDINTYILINDSTPGLRVKIMDIFGGRLIDENILIFPIDENISSIDLTNDERIISSLDSREKAIKKIKPNFVILTSYLDSLGDNIVVPTNFNNNLYRTIVIGYDIIPILFESQYLKNHQFNLTYKKYINYLRGVDYIWAISESTKKDFETHLEFNGGNIYNISASRPKELMSDVIENNNSYKKFPIPGKFILYCSAFDYRKNHFKLIEAYCDLPKCIKSKYSLVIAGLIPDEARVEIEKLIKKERVGNIYLLGYVNNCLLVDLYKKTDLFVYPSLYEGFGLPIIEAMFHGCIVIASNNSSMAEIISNHEQLFDPYDCFSISNKMKQFLTNNELRSRALSGNATILKNYSDLNQINKIINFFHVEKDEMTITSSRRDIELIYKKGDANNDDKDSSSEIDIFIDITCYIHNPKTTGIQRVLIGLIEYLCQLNNEKLNVELVWTPYDLHNFYKINYTINNFLKSIKSNADDLVDVQILSPVVFSENNILILVDINFHIFEELNIILDKLAEKRVAVYSYIHDIIPLKFQSFYDDIFVQRFSNWLVSNIKRKFNLIISSNAVRDDLIIFSRGSEIELNDSNIILNRHGVSFDAVINSNSIKFPSSLLNFDADSYIFLSVATIEPRKCYSQLIDAFSILHNKYPSVKLIIVGSVGWYSENVIDKILKSEHLHKSLFWFESCNDEELKYIYSLSDCFISCSLDEGYCLPIIEALFFKLKVLVRNAPFSIEFDSENIYYYESFDSYTLMLAMRSILFDLSPFKSTPNESDRSSIDSFSELFGGILFKPQNCIGLNKAHRPQAAEFEHKNYLISFASSTPNYIISGLMIDYPNRFHYCLNEFSIVFDLNSMSIADILIEFEFALPFDSGFDLYFNNIYIGNYLLASNEKYKFKILGIYVNSFRNILLFKSNSVSRIEVNLIDFNWCKK